MGEWEKDRVRELFEKYWKREPMPCPSDGTVLRSDLRQALGCVYESVSAECPRCGEGFELMESDDPQRQAFREWTTSEKKTLVDDYYRQRALQCPVDGAVLTARRIGNNLLVKCPRCGKQLQESLPVRP
jgi:endogenous inhibitor of DNA gyrase (YacG/DUF329 family)